MQAQAGFDPTLALLQRSMHLATKDVARHNVRDAYNCKSRTRVAKNFEGMEMASRVRSGMRSGIAYPGLHAYWHTQRHTNTKLHRQSA